MPPSNSLVSVYRSSDKKLIRVENSEAQTIAHVTLGTFKVTPFGMQEGYFVNTKGQLTYQGEPVRLSKYK